MSVINLSDKVIILGRLELEDAPNDMPLIGALLMLWRPLVVKIDSQYLGESFVQEELMDLFDSAVAGATNVSDGITSSIQRTIAYMDQIEGQINAPTRFREFVDKVG